MTNSLFCYSRHGLSMRAVPASYTPADGEQVFASMQTPEQLAVAFPEYPANRSNTEKLQEIQAYENSVTPRMLREAAAESTATFDGGPYDGKTSAEAIAFIDAQIVTLRGQLA